jgi:hypothetical protein
MTFLGPALHNLTDKTGDFTQNAIGFRDLCDYTLAISMPDRMGLGQGFLNTPTHSYRHLMINTCFVHASEKYMPHLIYVI